jgi:hypothetical protein
MKENSQICASAALDHHHLFAGLDRNRHDLGFRRGQCFYELLLGKELLPQTLREELSLEVAHFSHTTLLFFLCCLASTAS